MGSRAENSVTLCDGGKDLGIEWWMFGMKGTVLADSFLSDFCFGFHSDHKNSSLKYTLF
jgi:hypothetical protein